MSFVKWWHETGAQNPETTVSSVLDRVDRLFINNVDNSKVNFIEEQVRVFIFHLEIIFIS